MIHYSRKEVDAEIVSENIRNHLTGTILRMRESSLPPSICVGDLTAVCARIGTCTSRIHSTLGFFAIGSSDLCLKHARYLMGFLSSDSRLTLIQSLTARCLAQRMPSYCTMLSERARALIAMLQYCKVTRNCRNTNNSFPR